MIEARNICREYRVHENKKISDYFKFGKVKVIHAIDNVTLKITRGESIGLIGINGAGKSTLIKMMTGVLAPTSGYLKVLDRVPFNARKWNNPQIAAVFGQRTQLRWDVSVYESYRLHKAVYQIEESKYKKKLDFVIDTMDLSSFIDHPVRTLSLGQKMRAELGAAFLHSPRILFLDEPTLGLDIFSKEAMHKCIRDIQKAEDITIVLTTHDMRDIETICNRMVILHDGQIVLDDDIHASASLLPKEQNSTITFHEDSFILPPWLPDERYTLQPRKLFLFGLSPEAMSKAIAYIATNNQEIIENISIADLTLEDIVKRYLSDFKKRR